MKNEILKAVEVLKDKECSVYVQGGSTINEMEFNSAVVKYEEKTNLLTIGTFHAFISLDIDDCDNVNINGNEVYLQFINGLELEIRGYTKEELKEAKNRLGNYDIGEEIDVTKSDR